MKRILFEGNACTYFNKDDDVRVVLPAKKHLRFPDQFELLEELPLKITASFELVNWRTHIPTGRDIDRIINLAWLEFNLELFKITKGSFIWQLNPNRPAPFGGVKTVSPNHFKRRIVFEYEPTEMRSVLEIISSAF